MKYSLPILATCAGAVSGSFMERPMPAMLHRRDATAVTAAFADITAKTAVLNTAVQAYSKGSNFLPLQEASDAILVSIKAGDSSVAASGPLTVDEATGIATGVIGLNNTVASLVDLLIAKKDDFTADNHAGDILKSLTEQRDAAAAFATTVTSKTPDLVKPVADELSKGITASLEKGIAAFSGSAPPSGPPPSSPTSSPATPPSSSAPASPPGSSPSGSPPASPPYGSPPSSPPYGSPPSSKPTSVVEPIPGEPCPTEPGAIHPYPPASSAPAAPAEPKPTKPVVKPAPALPSKPASPPPAQYTGTGGAVRAGASMFALGVAVVLAL